MEELAVGAGADLVDDGGLQIDKDGTGNVLTGRGLAEEGVERVITSVKLLGNVTIWLDAVFKAVKLPAGVTNLDTGLADVDTNRMSEMTDARQRQRTFFFT